MMTYNKWDIVTVPFPFTDNIKSKPRPAVIVSSNTFNKKTDHSLLAMITTASNTFWYNDLPISDLSQAGLSAESFVRFKLFTLDNRIIIQKIGTLPEQDKASFTKYWQAELA